MPRPAVCPHCQEELDIPAEFRGRPVRCASCQKVFTPPADSPAPSAIPMPGNWAEDRPSRRPERVADQPVGRRDRDDDRPSRRPARDDYDRDRFDDRAPWDDRPRRPKKRSTLWIWLVALGVLGLCIVPCAGFFGLGVWVAFPKFQPYNSVEGRFRGEFPGQPFTYTQPGDNGQTRHCTEFKRSFPPETYFVHYVDLKDRKQVPALILKDAADKAVADVVGSTERQRSSNTTDGYPSLDLVVDHPDDRVTIVRFLLVERRLYMVGVTGQDTFDADNEPRLKHFLDAFKVQPAVPVK